MSEKLSQAGNFRGLITSYGLYEPGKDGSKSVAIAVTVKIDGAWDSDLGEWVDWSEYDLEAEGDLWIIKRDGTLNQNQVNALIKHAGWDGDPMSVAELRWEPTPCQFSVNEEKDPQGKYDTKYKVAFINAYDAIPGGGRKFLDQDAAKALASRYGSQFRALAGSLKQNAAAPTGKPSVPKKPPTKPQRMAAANQQLKTESGSKLETDINAELNSEDPSDIPF